MINKKHSSLYLLAALLFIVALFSSCNTIKEEVNGVTQSEKLSIEQYFRDNSTPINVTSKNEFDEYKITESELENNKIFLTGEGHGVKANYELRLAYLKLFKEKTNFKYYLCEIGYSEAYYMNQYLSTGDESIFEQVMNSFRYNKTWTKENYNHWVALYEYNKTLSDNDKIVVLGIDVEFSVHIAYRYLSDILPKKEIPSEINETIALIGETCVLLNKSFQNKYIAIKNAQLILDNINQYKPIYEDYLEENFLYFELVSKNIINHEEFRKIEAYSEEYYQTREKMIYDNFIAIDSILTTGKYYGQWGMRHVLQSEISGVVSFASHLYAEGSKYEDQVLSIVYNYLDCEAMGVSIKHPTELDFTFPVIFENQYYGDEKYVLYKIHSNDVDKPHIAMIDFRTGEAVDEDMSEFFQYILLIKGSEATEPFGS